MTPPSLDPVTVAARAAWLLTVTGLAWALAAALGRPPDAGAAWLIGATVGAARWLCEPLETRPHEGDPRP